jgi:hypothetical protein
MRHSPKIFLAAAVIFFVIGMLDLAENAFFYLGKPLAAIFFILFMMFQFLQKEVALYDREQEAKRVALKDQAKRSKPTSAEPGRPGRNVPAHSLA